MKKKLIVGLYGLSRFNNDQPGYAENNITSTDNTINYAVQSGIKYFDTAPGYGGGAADKLLNRLQRQYMDLKITSKFGLDIKNSKFNMSAPSLSLEALAAKEVHGESLSRLLLHSPPEAFLLNKSGVVSLLKSLNDTFKGLIGLGISLSSPLHLPLVSDFGLDFPLHLQFNYSWLDKRAVPFLSNREDLVYSARSVYGSGLLSSIFNFERTEDFLGLRFPDNDIRSRWNFENMYTHCKEEIAGFLAVRDTFPNWSLSQVVLSMFEVDNSHIDSIVLGPQTIEEVESSLNAFTCLESLPSKDLSLLKTFITSTNIT